MNYIIDLDGTLLDGPVANRDSVAFIRALNDRQANYLIMTNSIKAPEAIVDRLKAVGIEVDVSRIINPIVAMNTYLLDKGFKKAHVLGSQFEKDQVLLGLCDHQPDVVMLLDFEKDNLGYQDLQKVYDFMAKDIPVYTASKSLYYRKRDNKALDTGAFVALLEQVSGRSIHVLGKPSETYFESALKILQSEPSQTLVIGDDWQTDGKGGLNMGCQAVLLTSGKYQEGDEKRVAGLRRVTSLMDLLGSER